MSRGSARVLIDCDEVKIFFTRFSSVMVSRDSIRFQYASLRTTTAGEFKISLLIVQGRYQIVLIHELNVCVQKIATQKKGSRFTDDSKLMTRGERLYNKT